jgi:murein DD-endopeptidase MepM/ murein hydrolase activator NlpD
MRVIAASVVLGILPVGAIAAAPADASPLDYPTWQQVQQAQQAEDATKTLVAQIQAQLAQLQAASQAAQADAEAKGNAYAKAQEAYDQQDYETQQLEAQVDAAKKDADTARDKAARMVAQLAKSNGGADSTASLLTSSSGGSADAQLYRLQAYNQLIKQSQGIYDHALQLQKNAQALTDQATVQKKLLAELEVKAQAALAAAQDAATKAADAVDAETTHEAQMQAQLAVLTQKRQATQADYDAGVAAEAARRAALGGGGRVASSGWADPASGELLDKFGMRFSPIYGTWQLHSGQDIANSCGTPIYAAASGTIKYAGWYSDLGNYITITHADGVVTGYGHIVNGGILVRIGQHVEAGDQIARIGTTGGSTGCHLHYSVFVNGSLVDPVPFMRDRGVTLG